MVFPSFYWLLLTVCSLSISHIRGDAESHRKKAQSVLEQFLERTENRNVAKNIVLIIGDGMSLPTVAAARFLKGEKAGKSGVVKEMLYETFPNVGLARTYAMDKYVADSASTATAFLCGIKTKYEALAVDENVKGCTSVNSTKVSCIGEWAIEEGKAVGLVTNMRVSHSTPAVLYSHSSNRWFESDISMKEKDHSLCKDIARQMVEDYPGKNLQVILGGGRELFLPNTTSDPEYPKKKGKRVDDLQLIETWKEQKKAGNYRYHYVWNKTDFDAVDAENTDYLLGLFEPTHMHDVIDMANNNYNDPSLTEMTEKAIRILRRNSNGFFLLVEGGLIDYCHHNGKAVRAVSEALDLENAVKAALDLTNREDTLVIVTSDHSQGMHLVGYGGYTKGIFGLAGISHLDKKPYTTLLYSTGPGYNVTSTGRLNISGIDTTDKDYLQQATVPRTTVAHSGEDVAVYAVGPMAHLFTGVYDQHYIAHAMAYAACVGSNTKHCSGPDSLTAAATYLRQWTWWIQLAAALAVALLIF